MKLRGQHCQCGACFEYFNSTSAFDKHRTGEWTERRCLTRAEMTGKGMFADPHGWWYGSKYRRPESQAKVES